MKISDFDIYHLPPLMGSFVDFIEDKCRKLLEESPQFTELMREDHELLDKYWFLNTITDTNGVTNALNLSYEEREEKLEIFIPNGPRLGSKVIEAKNVAKAYGDKLLFDDLNFMLPPNGIVGIIEDRKNL